jgi:UDP-N-acetylmuramoyl-L-alanyl-D-glutamate--2,6-diaminopimelate ligase
VALHAVLTKLAQCGVTHLALEASSHGLKQCRLDGVRFAAGAFTNLSRDHLDYHADVEDYFDAKARLFTDLLLPGASAVVNVDTAEGVRIAGIAGQRGLVVLTVGANGETIRLLHRERKAWRSSWSSRPTSRSTRSFCRWWAISRSPTRWSPPA